VSVLTFTYAADFNLSIALLILCRRFGYAHHDSRHPGNERTRAIVIARGVEFLTIRTPNAAALKNTACQRWHHRQNFIKIGLFAWQKQVL